jgi:hypothetical protein
MKATKRRSDLLSRSTLPPRYRLYPLCVAFTISGSAWRIHARSIKASFRQPCTRGVILAVGQFIATLVNDLRPSTGLGVKNVRLRLTLCVRHLRAVTRVGVAWEVR